MTDSVIVIKEEKTFYGFLLFSSWWMFEKMARFIRESDEFDSEKRNVITIKIEGTSENVAIEYFDKSVGLYKLKKEWKANNL